MHDLLLARRYLFRGKAKHVSFIGIVSCLGIALGVAAVIIAISIVNGVDGGLMERIMRFKPHLVVEADNDEAVLAKVRDTAASWKEVTLASLSLQTQVFVKFKENVAPVVVKGVELDRQKDFFSRYIVYEAAPNGFYAGKDLMRRYGINDKIEFYPLQKKLELETRPLRGAFRVGLYDVDNYYLIADLNEAKALSPNYHLFLELQIKDPYAVDAVKDRLTGLNEKIYVTTWIETNRALFTTLKLERFAMFLILGIIILIASFNMFAMLTVKVVEKTRDIGVMKALGFTRFRVMRVFALQGILLGVLGVGSGLGVGLGACYLLKTYPFIKIPAEVFFTEYLPVVVSYRDVAMICAVGLAIACLASIFPAMKAASMETCEALRYE